jgi:hypothetical protein
MRSLTAGAQYYRENSGEGDRTPVCLLGGETTPIQASRRYTRQLYRASFRRAVALVLYSRFVPTKLRDYF